jgi:hypothetical protein
VSSFSALIVTAVIGTVTKDSAAGLPIAYLLVAATWLLASLTIILFGPETKRQALEAIAA